MSCLYMLMAAFLGWMKRVFPRSALEWLACNTALITAPRVGVQHCLDYCPQGRFSRPGGGQRQAHPHAGGHPGVLPALPRVPAPAGHPLLCSAYVWVSLEPGCCFSLAVKRGGAWFGMLGKGWCLVWNAWKGVVPGGVPGPGSPVMARVERQMPPCTRSRGLLPGQVSVTLRNMNM